MRIIIISIIMVSMMILISVIAIIIIIRAALNSIGVFDYLTLKQT